MLLPMVDILVPIEAMVVPMRPAIVLAAAAVLAKAACAEEEDPTMTTWTVLLAMTNS
jgi:hypothetical protein